MAHREFPQPRLVAVASRFLVSIGWKLFPFGCVALENLSQLCCEVWNCHSAWPFARNEIPVWIVSSHRFRGRNMLKCENKHAEPKSKRFLIFILTCEIQIKSLRDSGAPLRCEIKLFSWKKWVLIVRMTLSIDTARLLAHYFLVPQPEKSLFCATISVLTTKMFPFHLIELILRFVCWTLQQLWCCYCVKSATARSGMIRCPAAIKYKHIIWAQQIYLNSLWHVIYENSGKLNAWKLSSFVLVLWTFKHS